MLPFPDAVAVVDPPTSPDRYRVAYRIGDLSVSYRELVDASIRWANLLRARGVRRGDTVAVLLANERGFFEVTWACQRAGLRYTALNTHFTAQGLSYIVRDSGAKAVITSARFAAVLGEALADLKGTVEAISIDGGPGLIDARPLLAAQPPAPSGPECEGVDLLYSSGTTGRPKGVSSTPTFAPLGTPAGSVPWLQQTWGFGEDTVYLSPAPLYHAAPMRTCQAVQRFGGTVIVMERFDAREALELIAEHRVTHTQMVPTMFSRLLRLDDEVRASFDVSSLRAVIHAAAPCPVHVKRAMIEWLGPIVDEYYSCTENILMTMITSKEALDRPGSVGRASLGTIHILDDDGRELPAGQVGTIWSEGGLDFDYLNDPVKTEASRDERGWRTVGDLGQLDADGYLYLSDRRLDLIVSGGVNVYPQEVENVLVQHPVVADAAVIAAPDPDLGQQVTAVVELLPDGVATPDELIAWCRDRLAAFKCPRSVEIAEKLPRTPTGKLLRRVLRDAAEAQS